MKMQPPKATALLITVLVLLGASHGFDPYKTLNLKRGASIQEIRRAYKQSAKEWHPDKNKDEDAGSKFVEINKAYELLSDPVRRKLYDQKGVVEEAPNTQTHPNQPSDDFYNGMPSFFSQSGGFRFQFKMSEMNYFHKQTITLRNYENSILPQSLSKPYLVLIYSEWCMMCLHILPLWQRLTEDLEPIGITLATVHFDQERELAEKLGGHRGELPHIVLLVDSKVAHYRDYDQNQFSIVKVIEFIRSRFPRNLMNLVDHSNYKDFLNGWRKDNKVRVLMFGKHELVRLRYLTVALKFRPHAVFGYVRTDLESTSSILEKLEIPFNLDSFLVFQEDNEHPVARLSLPDLPFSLMKETMEANKYLALPRLSSQGMLDSLCPPEVSVVRRRLCAILLTDDRTEDDEVREQLRQFKRQLKFGRDRIAFTYIFKEKQTDFLNAISMNGAYISHQRYQLVILWRQDVHRVSLTWLPQPFASGLDNWNTSKDALKRSLTEILDTSHALTDEIVLAKELVDENALGILGKLYSRVISIAESFRERVTRQDILAVVSVIGTVLFIAAVGYVMAYLVRIEEETVQRQNQTTSGVPRTNATELKLHELRTETYNGMVRLLKPGCRTVVLLLDNQSKSDLIPKFHKAVWPYRKNKSLMFGWMNVDRGLNWYSRLLNLALKNVDDANLADLTLDPKHVKTKNCVGTVVSLNGHRRYFCIYHVRHPESFAENGAGRMQSMARRLTKSSQTIRDVDGAFIGFDSSEESDNSDVEKGEFNTGPVDEKPLIDSGSLPSSPFPTVETALDGFPNWLDRLFEGTTHRYYVNYWPDFGNY